MQAILNQLPSVRICQRSLTSSLLAVRTVSSSSRSPAALPSGEPAKLYGVTYVPPLKTTRHHTKRADYGLYDGLKVKSGDNIPKSKQRTRRVWNPNVQKISLWSEILGQTLQLRVTTAALKTIDKVGGLDRYVLQMSDERLGGTGMRIRDLVIAAMKQRLKLSQAFTRPIPESEAWKIPQWQNSSERADRTIVRRMVPSVDVKEVTVYPRKFQSNGQVELLALKDLNQRGQRGSQTCRRSTHPRR
ncbi:hypothetical protein CROQUDRAFT_662396 [Cronartium quercuum f. sp. fusiforme G11]|uniref:Large ribosomal subunit protein bL28m n=1 Tax=Cronartium quercuum f. sp. fusiforme G11 TaxID=708437 RepID=A0A9P6T812_9BASI|nr:hypothetical protein CROQUDRAFT_662396 [Cronartium quercuum f. sp. fusiforme G11]